MDSDFIHIEKTFHNGKSVLKINDSSNPQEFIDPIDGKPFQPHSPDKPLTTLPIVEGPKKPEMVVTDDNYIINHIQKRLETMKLSLNFDYLNLPMLINFIQEELRLYKFPNELEMDYLRYLVLWTDKTLFTDIPNENRMTDLIYCDMVHIYRDIRYHPFILKPVSDIPFVDDFVNSILKSGLLDKVGNVFEAVWVVIKEVNNLPLINYQKKLYVLNVISKLGSRNIFPSESECQKLVECIPLYPNFIDTVVYLNKRIHPKVQIGSNGGNIFTCCFPSFNDVLYI